MTVLELLLWIEWQGDERRWVCPFCHESRMAGHLKTCELAKQIAAEHEAEQ